VSIFFREPRAVLSEWSVPPLMATPDPKKPLLIKLLLIGDSGVGKSCLLLRFTENNFNDSYISTIGIDFKIRDVEIGGKMCTLQVWDTAGQERFRTITSAYYRGAHGIALVYDVTSRESFDNMTYWLKHMQKYANADVCKILVGNKTDLLDKRVVPTSEGQQLASRSNCEFYETSAKTGEGVEHAFMELSKEIKKRKYDTPAHEEPSAAAKKGLKVNNAGGSGAESGGCKCG